MPATPAQTYDYKLEPLSGDALNASEFKNVAFGTLHSSITADPIDEGCIVHQNSATIISDLTNPLHAQPAKTFRPGATNLQVPYLVIRGTRELDSVGFSDARLHGWATMRAGTKSLTALCNMDSAEVATQKFDTVQTYTANQPLRAVRSDSLATAGTLTNQTVTPGTTLICAQVTSGKLTNQYGLSVLHMQLCYIWGSEAAS
jgi:hypothetical protein